MSYLAPGLAAYADQIISVAGKTLAVKDLVYSSQEDIYGVCAFAKTAGVVNANQSQEMFSLKPGDIGQGFTVAATLSETNNTNGTKFQGNELYLATGIGFDWYMAKSAADPTPLVLGYQDVLTASATNPLTSWDMKALGFNFFVSVLIGSGTERVYGNIGQYPIGSQTFDGGIAAGSGDGGSFQFASKMYEVSPANGGPNCPMRDLTSPLVFPPNIDFHIYVANKTAVDVLNNSSTPVVACRGVLRGFRMTLPV